MIKITCIVVIMQWLSGINLEGIKNIHTYIIKTTKKMKSLEKEVYIVSKCLL